MMDYTQRMARLLGAMRRERNGAVAESMRYRGRAYGLNYGVSLPTLRTLARAEGRDHAYARYLYLQDVRELRLAAFHIADPAQVTEAELPFWGAGLLNSEMAEEGAFALFSRAACLPELFGAWTAAGSGSGSGSNSDSDLDSDLDSNSNSGFGFDSLRAYAALMAAARTTQGDAAWAATAAAVVRRAASRDHSEAHLLAQGATALLAALAVRDDVSRRAVTDALMTLGDRPAETYVREELAWRLEE